MKAILLMGHGGPEMLRYGEAPDPTAGPGEVVVDIYAASVNAADYKVRLGGERYALNRLPHILGRDFSGVVSALGAGVTLLWGILSLGSPIRARWRPASSIATTSISWKGEQHDTSD